MYSKHRLEALSDGIFAIVMTLLVLDLKVPEGALPAHFGTMLAQQWLSFVLTFVIAAIFWTLQHRLFDLMGTVHHRTLVPTFVFLGLVAVLPFSTALLGHRLDERVGFVVYYTNQFLIALALTVKLLVARLPESAEVKLLRIRLFSMCVIMTCGIVGASLLPVKWSWIPAAVVAGISKRIRRAAEQKTKLAAA